MNKNNLSWVDNKVFNNTSPQNTTPQMRPFMDTAPAQFQAAPTPAAAAPSAVSPATYQDTTAKNPPMTAPSAVSPTSNQDMTPMPAPTGVSPATYQDMMPNASQQTAPAPSGVSPATYQNMTPGPVPTGVSPAQYMSPASMSPAPMSPAPMSPAPTGVSPAQYQPGPAIYPVQTGGAPAASSAAPGALTRDVTYGPNPFNIQGPPTVLDPGYIPAYLRTQIGKRVRAEFNIGTNLYMDRTGVLREVGVSYFVLEDNVTHVRVMCDLYSLKFLTTEA